MTITYNWKITPHILGAVSVNGQSIDNVYSILDWEFTGSQGEVSITKSGTPIILNFPDPTSYVPADKVTDAMLLDWVTAALTPEVIANLKTQIASELNPVDVVVHSPNLTTLEPVTIAG